MLTSIQVKRMAREAGFDLVGITSAQPFPEFVPSVKEREREGLLPEEALREDEILRLPEIYADPEKSLQGARSVISLGLAYRIDGVRDRSLPGKPCGVLPRAFWRNFYREAVQRRSAFIEVLEQNGVRCSSPPKLSYKSVAHRAGVGCYVRSGVVHADTYGPWILVQAVVTDAELEPDRPMVLDCGTCRRCIEACPTKAIVRPYTVDVGRCITHLLASSEPMPREMRTMVGNRINGCDLCKEVCPRALNPLIATGEFLDPLGRWTNSPELIPLLDITEEEFQRCFGDLDWYQGEVRLLKRNAIIALGNQGDPVAVRPLIRMLDGEDAMLRGHAAWALGRLGGKDARDALMQAREREKDGWARREIEAALHPQTT